MRTVSATGTPRRDDAPLNHASPRSLRSPAAALRHQEKPKHAHWPAGTLYMRTPSTSSAGTCDRDEGRLPSSLPLFPCNQAQHGRRDIAEPLASWPANPRPCSNVTMITTSAAPRPRSAAIKGALPSPNKAHYQLPLLSLALLDPSLLDIHHRSHPIASSEP
jgi:hypothetical protein